ncbi:MAG: DinB family protein [Flavobacteriales bacterium]|nr:DinB family protein [Flavobacteriales bacterium]MBK6943941.1 DinB family protein [Flavobacteriales bacterium]MBK9533612.1 DinB family protein [Flavobacteriales bacterium]HQV51633.1 DinB family protein [Flavobacteriales bacterium]HQZ42819.1 DinB family protein [Flavobacteriales bacterium]
MSRSAALLQLFDGMERDRLALYARLDPLSETALAAEPAPGKWSVAQVITHLAIAEEGALAYLLKKRDLGAHGPVPFSARWRMAALRAALYLPFKYNAPAVVATVPSTSCSVAMERWAAVRNAMRSTYVSIPESEVGHDLFKHPIVGKFDLIQSVKFMHHHMRHHEKQIERTLRSVK